MGYTFQVGAPGYLRGVSRFHRLLQEIVAAGLSSMGFDVSIEEPLPGGLVADVYGEAPWGSIIVEVETGFVAPGMLESAEDYLKARIAWKSIRYSRHADLFAVAMPSFVEIPIPGVLVGRGGRREAARLLGLLRGLMGVDGVVGLDDVMNARVDAVIKIVLSSRRIMVKSLNGHYWLLEPP